MSSRKQRKRIKNIYKDRDYNITVPKKITKDMLIKTIEELCSGHNIKEPPIFIINGLTNKQINELLTFKTN